VLLKRGEAGLHEGSQERGSGSRSGDATIKGVTSRATCDFLTVAREGESTGRRAGRFTSRGSVVWESHTVLGRNAAIVGASVLVHCPVAVPAEARH
jgi:hypothetical protein